jgi:IS30 family transposase
MHAQITLEERYAINVMRKQRYSIRMIARELGRAPSTISRELRRNLRPTGRYVPDIATNPPNALRFTSGARASDCHLSLPYGARRLGGSAG